MTRSERAYDLEEAIQDWRKRLEKAFLSVVNTKRRLRNQLPYSKNTQIDLPSRSNANLRLLTLKVWCLRYSVTPEWMLEQLLYLFRNRRNSDDDPTQLVLGLPAELLVGTVASNYIQERLQLDFPNGENKKSLNTPVPRVLKQDDWDFSIPDTLEKYTQAITKERKRFDKAVKLQNKRKRNFRQI
jgi:hypothetical protein